MRGIKLCLWLALFVTLFSGTLTLAGTVRDIHTDDRKMNKVHLTLGQSTVLRFQEVPRKVVIGNQNYFNVEFVEGSRDVTLQPLGAVKTNLFVYTKGKTYGFILYPKNHGRYDDLINIHWREKPKMVRARAKILLIEDRKVKKLGQKLNLDDLSIELLTLTKSKQSQLVIIDIKISNRTPNDVNLSAFKVVATRRNTPLERQSFALSKLELKRGDSTTLRLVVNLRSKLGFTINFENGDTKIKTIISRRLIL
jgi:hypothetical protein